MSRQHSKRRTKVSPMDDTHSQDWSTLDLGFPTVSCRTERLVDFDVYVHGLREIQDSTLPIAIVLIAHGFANMAREMTPMASGLIGEGRRLDDDLSHERRRVRDLLVVTLDLRGHGERTLPVPDAGRKRSGVERLMGLAQSASKFNVVVKLTAAAGRHDMELIMEFLGDKVFPQGEREIVEYMAMGFSLGAHSVWRFLRDDPRVRIGVPMGSLPPGALGPALYRRWLKDGDTSKLPPATRRFYDTSPAKLGTYAGKKILSVHGGQDEILPYRVAQSAWEAVAAGAEHAARYVEEDKGHVVTAGMVIKAAEWFWYFGLTEAR